MKRFLCLFCLLLTLLVPTAHCASITRGEFALLLWRQEGGLPWDKTAHPFPDVEQDALAQAVAWGYERGIWLGTGDGLFAPERPLTRAECAAVLRRLDRSLGRDVFLPDGASICNDREDLPSWADDSLYWACITQRMSWRQGRLSPEGDVTQAQAVRWTDPEGGSEPVLHHVPQM